MKALEWLLDNKTWIFSGIGVIVLSVLARALFTAFLKPSREGTSQKQRAKAGTSVLQVGRDINVNIPAESQPPALRVLAHRAYFVESPLEHFFIKIVNITPEVDVEVTHVWYQNGRRVDILSRPLPVRLRPSETWETFVPTNAIGHDRDVFKHFHVLVSTGQRFASEQNRDVPPAGYVAGR